MSTFKKAGGIVVSKNDPNKICLVYRIKHSDWQFPKGHIEDDETAEQAAVREIQEETGLDVEVVGPLPDMDYSFPDGNSVLLNMFLCRSLDDSKLNCNIVDEEAAWVDIKDVVDKLTPPNLKEYFQKVVHSLTK